MEEKWYGFKLSKFIFEEHEAIIVFPNKSGNLNLAVKTEYWGAFPQAVETSLLDNGFTLCYIKNDNRWGMDSDLERKARFIKHVQRQYGLNPQCVLVGMSCGGLIAIKIAAKYPELVSCLYLDAPVLNYMSCPCGFGVGVPLNDNLDEILDALSLDNVSELLAYRDMPLDYLKKLVENYIPAVMVAGADDSITPYCENGVFLERAYREAGVPIEVHMKPGCGHHPHGLEKNEPVLKFIEKYTKV